MLTAEGLDAALRRIGAERYHNLHPFHRVLHGGKLNKGQVQAWGLNRYCYQSAIPRKDAALIAGAGDSELRRIWRQRLADHDGDAPGSGGIVRWLVLTDGLGLDRDYVVSMAGALPATRFAVQAYVRFVAERSLLEAVASSPTQMFSPDIISDRVAGMLAGLAFTSRDTPSPFKAP